MFCYYVCIIFIIKLLYVFHTEIVKGTHFPQLKPINEWIYWDYIWRKRWNWNVGRSKTHTLEEHEMRKETSVLAFEGEIPESWAIPLLAEWHCSTRQIAFRNRRTERICWSIMYLPFVLAELRTSSSCFVQEKRMLEIMWCWKWPEMVFHRLPLYHRIKPCQDPAVSTETPSSLLWNS